MSVKIVHSIEASKIEHLFGQITQTGIPTQAVDIYKGRNRVVKLNVPGFGDINIKEFRIPHAINRVVYGNFRRSKARRAYEFAIKLRQIGFNTPTPLAYIEIRSMRLLGLSYFISQQLDGYQDMRNIHDYTDKERLLDQLAELMTRLHNAGVFMKDFSQGNILWKLTDDDKYDFQLVDINRMAFNEFDSHKLMLNFRAISDYDDDLRTLAEAYARHANLNPDETISQVLEIRANFIHQRQLKQKFRSK